MKEELWDSSLNPKDVIYIFSKESQEELRSYIKSLPIYKGNFTDLKQIERGDINNERIPLAAEEIEKIREQVEEGIRFAVVKPVEKLSLEEQMMVPWIVSNLLGKTLEQNTNGDRLYMVTDRGGRMEEGARYSQTNQGGSFHTDGVNQKDPYEYFALSCVSPAKIGGESVVISGFSVYNFLKEKSPETLKILGRDFVWEYKGLKDNEFYEEPVVKFIDGEPIWRYLRNYMEEAVAKRGERLSAEKVWALNTLDAALELSRFHFRHSLQCGETAIFNDRQVFHGRTSFSDDPKAILLGDYLKGDKSKPIKRTYLRIWIKHS